MSGKQRLSCLPDIRLAVPDGGAVAAVGVVRHGVAHGKGAAGVGFGGCPLGAGLWAGLAGGAAALLADVGVGVELVCPVDHVLGVVGEVAQGVVVEVLQEGDGAGFEAPVAVVAGLVGFEVGVVPGQAFHAGFVPALDVLQQVGFGLFFAFFLGIQCIMQVGIGFEEVQCFCSKAVVQAKGQKVFVQHVFAGKVAILQCGQPG